MVLRSTPPRLLSGKGRRMKLKERYNLVYIDWPMVGRRMLLVTMLSGMACLLAVLVVG